MKTILKITPLLFIVVVFFTNCNKDEPINIFTVEDDKTLGLQVKDEIESDPATYPILSETAYPDAYKHLRRIRDTILASGKVGYADEFNWECKLINDDVLNAFCAPGGYIYVYTGLINYLDNEAQFAGVLGHEMAHAARRHSTSQLTKAYGVSVLLSLITGNDPGLIAQVTASLLVLAFSRSNENDADAYSVVYLNPSHYDARGVAGFFEKLHEGDSSGTNIPFLSTHPSDANRIENINNKWMDLGSVEGDWDSLSYISFKNSLP
ncbi:MAG: M48 family metalloprotease [Bacteroidetes bacterium]|nr:M48 family metalloprotease [Bacteroidota bacterium]MBL6962445.1 M48 family metalloprotease [Bacteroidota bacterium]